MAKKLAGARKAAYHAKITNRWFDQEEKGGRATTTKDNIFDSYRSHTAGELLTRFREGGVLSVFRFKGQRKTWYSSFGKDRNVMKVVPIKLNQNCSSIEVLGSHYHEFTIDSKYYQPNRDDIISRIAENGIMFPMPNWEETGTRALYSIVTDKWCVLDEFGQTSIPLLPPSLFKMLEKPHCLTEIVGKDVAVLFEFYDDKTNETGMDWYAATVTAYNQRSDQLTVVWTTEGGADQLVLSLDDYGVNHMVGGWKLI